MKQYNVAKGLVASKFRLFNPIVNPIVNDGAKPAYLLFFLIISAAFLNNSFAQDANYWTHQFGSRSTLLGGAVVGSVLDLSGTYYNPGGLSLIDDPDILLAAKVFEYPNYYLTPPFQNAKQLNSSRLGPAPSIVATMFSSGWLGNHRLALSYLTRYDVKLDLSNVEIFTGDQRPITSNGNHLITNFQLSERLSDPWFGITWSYKYHQKVGMGMTQYLSLRSHRAQILTNTEVITSENDVYLARNAREYYYNSYGLLWKFGITFDFLGFTFGLTATTPSLKLYGNGSIGLNQTSIGPDLDGDGNLDTDVIADYQEDLKAKYKNPFSLGLGTTVKIQRTLVYLSAEWFNGIPHYSVMEGKLFVSQIVGDTLENKLTHELAEVLNIGIGLQHSLNENVSLSASFTTDFSARKSGSETNLSIASWDIYHIMLGTTFRVKKSEFTLGLGYAYGNDTFAIDLPYSERSLINNLDPELNDVKFSYQNVKFVFGFTI
ncbi:MAG: hypothetical protein KAJ16_09375 [Calditrichia bacterium]|nr:hypothetical protein [Calditrichia bacterium]